MDDTASWTLGFGLGLELWREGDRILVGHEGAMPGFLAGVLVSRQDKVGAAVFANAGNRSQPGKLCAKLVTTVLEREPTPVEAWAPGAPPRALAGALDGGGRARAGPAWQRIV
jgi:hypothetical protein